MAFVKKAFRYGYILDSRIEVGRSFYEYMLIIISGQLQILLDNGQLNT